MRALFIYNPADLHASPPGGVQKCTAEFRQILSAGFSEVVDFEVGYDNRLLAKLKRRSRLFPYSQYNPAEYEVEISKAAASVDFVFINRTELFGFVDVLRKVAAHLTPVVMSHGNESGDLVYELGVHRASKHRNWFVRAYDYLWLGGDLAAEAHARWSGPIVVCVMSEEEAVIERWLGTDQVFVLPRSIDMSPLEWEPRELVVGYVGSLHHTPNIVALEQVLSQLKEMSSDIEVEIVGRPPEIGKALEARYPNAKYLGPLPEHELQAVATSWSLFLNPIFWLSKGASMKLSQALGWGLPTLTTKSGRRGYELPEGCVEQSEDDPELFVRRLCEVLQTEGRLSDLRTKLLASEKQITTSDLLGERLAKFVGSE